MAWLREADRERLRTEFSEVLRSPVELSVSGCEAQALEVLREIASLSPRLTLSQAEPTGLDPTIELRGRNRGRVAFVGLPMGYEFPTLIDAIRDVSTGETSLSADDRERLAEIRSERRLKVFTTPT